MTPTVSASAEQTAVHWTVKSNYLLRICAFAIIFASIAFHGYENGLSPVAWGLAILQLLVYPHVAFWFARRARNPQQAEVNNLTVDCLLFGILVATMEFPMWITFTVYIASTLNITINRGAWGLLRSQIAFFGGALAAVALLGWHVSPATAWPTTALSLLGNMVYMVAIGIGTYNRNQQLREAREALRVGEQTLKKQLVEIQTLQVKLQEQATRDPLTGLYSRRFLDTIASRELARCEREGLHLSLMMIDVDHLKKLYDSYGAAGGDAVLKRLAALLLEKVRVIDVACRYGSEQFVLLLPSMPPDIALLRAEQWRAAIAKEVVSSGSLRMQATVSIGIASYPAHGDTMAALTRCADSALYRATQEGRNRVVLCQSEMDGGKP